MPRVAPFEGNNLKSKKTPIISNHQLPTKMLQKLMFKSKHIASLILVQIQVVPGRAGGGSFKRKKNYIAKKEFAYRMCARWPTIAMSKLFLGFERSFCRCRAVMSCALGWCVCDSTCFQVMWLVVRWFVVLLRYYSVLQRTTPVLLCTTKYYSSTTLYYKVLLQYYSVLHSTTPVLLSTTKYYASTTLYYKVLRQYYSSTTKYYASTTLYYKVLRQYNSVLQRITPVQQCTTRVLQSTTPLLLQYYKGLRQCVEQVKSPLQPHQIVRLPRKMNVINDLRDYETSFPMRRQSEVTRQPLQILRLPRKMNVINDLRHIWNVISNAWSNESHPPTSPNTAPATQNECRGWSAPHINRHFQCAEAVKSPSNLTKYCACHAKWTSSMICVTFKRHFQCVEQVQSPSNLTKYCACHEILKLKISAETPWMLPPIERRFDDNPTISDNIRGYPTIKSSSRTRRFGDLTRPILETIFYCKIQHFALRLSPKMSRSAAPATKSHPPTSPNTAPATQNECHQWSASHMKRHFQCVEQRKSPSNLTKYCACHAKWTLLNCYFTELLLYWTATLLNCDSTELLLYWSVTLLNCYFTELWLYWTVTLVICYFTEVLLDWSVTWLICYLTDLLLDWSFTLLNCYFTDLLLYWSVICYFTKVLLDWSFTWLICYFTEELLDWSVTLLICYFTEFSAFLKVHNSEVSHPNFLW